jgi:hypothetical protein
MNYSKPEVATLGEAVDVIELILIKLPITQFDAFLVRKVLNPAYDLDE